MDHQSLQHCLNMNNSEMSASEVHGCLWGLFTTEIQYQQVDWKPSLTQLLDQESQSLSVDLLQCLQQVVDDIIQQLEANMFEMSLLLAEDEQPLNQRIEELGRWCEGWLLGFGLGHSSDKDLKLSDEGKEALSDIRDISQVDSEYEADLTEDDLELMECDFLQLCEHVKISVQIIHSDISSSSVPKSAIQKSKSIH